MEITQVRLFSLKKKRGGNTQKQEAASARVTAVFLARMTLDGTVKTLDTHFPLHSNDPGHVESSAWHTRETPSQELNIPMSP